MRTFEQIIKEGNEGHPFRDVINGLMDEQIIECVEEYAREVVKNITSNPHVIKSVCEKYPYPIQMYCYKCDGCKKAGIEQTV